MSAEISGSQKAENFCPACEKSYPLDVSFCPDDGTDLVRIFEPKDPMLGRKLGQRFLLESKLGVGGMGTVYLATQLSIGRKVAVKVIDRNRSGESNIAKRFLREAKLSSRLSQANTVSIYDFGQDEDGTLFLAMELIKGKELADVIESEGTFIPKRVKNIGVQLCDALEAAHSLSIIHRDLKPSNIMMLDHPAGRDFLKVLDFGLAKSLIGEAESVAVTQSGMAMGTPLYISPEAVTGKTGDTRTDLYSVGIILYELLAGTPPFVSQNTTELFHMHLSTPPPEFSSKVPKGLAEVVLRLLEKDPDARYSSAAETRQALMAAFGEAPEPVTHIELKPAGKIDGVELSLPKRDDSVAATILAELEQESPSAAPEKPTEQVLPKQESSPVLSVPVPAASAPLSPSRRSRSLVVAGGIAAALGLGVYVASLQFSGDSSKGLEQGEGQVSPETVTKPVQEPLLKGSEVIVPVVVDAGLDKAQVLTPVPDAADAVAKTNTETETETEKLRNITKRKDRHKGNKRGTKSKDEKKPDEEKKPGLESIGHQLPP